MADSELTVGNHIKQEIGRRVLMAEKAHELGKKYIMVDIDGTICHCPGDPKSGDDQFGFREAVPHPKRIDPLDSMFLLKLSYNKKNMNQHDMNNYDQDLLLLMHLK